MENTEYVIVGDTKEYEDCLLFPCGDNKKIADETLDRILNRPTANDKKIIEGCTNFRIKENPKERCWWNDNCD